MKKFLITSIIVSLITPTVAVFADAEGGTTKVEETACFKQLNIAAQGSAKFGVNLSAVKKKTNHLESEEFDVSTYDKFLDISAKAIPRYANKLGKYPTAMTGVPPSQKYVGYNTYKTNRNNIGTILYTDGSDTAIRDTSLTLSPNGMSDSIDGYYIDTKIITFGEKNDFFFPTPSRDPDSNNLFPFGDPYLDMREYILYTHHLADRVEADESKQFLSCGLIKITPQNGLNHSDISVNNYGGNVFEGSSYTTKIEMVDGKKFRQGDVVIQTVDTNYVAGDSSVSGNEFAAFDVITLAYDNDSSFLNEFITLELQKNAMSSPPSQSQGMNSIIQQFYNSIPSNLGIKSGVTSGTIAMNIKEEKLLGSLLQASSIKDSVAVIEKKALVINNGGQKKAGLAMYEGVSIDTINAIDKIENKQLRDYLRVNVVPGYKEVFQKKNIKDLSTFEKSFLDCDLSEQERAENVEYLISLKTKSGKKLDPLNLEYKDPRFGRCGVPFMDKREQALLITSPLEDVLQESLNAHKLLIKDIDDKTKGALLEDKSRLKQQKKNIQDRLDEKVTSIEKSQKVYGQCAQDKLYLDIDFKNGKITEVAYRIKKRLTDKKCKIALTESVSSVLPSGTVEKIIKQIEKPIENIVAEAEKKQATSFEKKIDTPRNNVEKNMMLYKILGIFLFLISILFLAKVIFKKK